MKTALHQIIRTGHIELDFTANARSVWWDGYFRQTDWHPPTVSHPNGFFWCMYSTDSLAVYVSGTVQNREHAMPRSWWLNNSIDGYGFANGDLHNLFPSNAAANAAKSNFPLGTTRGERFNNGVIRVGRSTTAGFSGTVFEPPDRYKGDFARVFMYMVTRYEDYAGRWTSIGITSMLIPNSRFPTFTTYAINLLLEWHRNDPVSQKEIDRNNAVHRIQNNRNPFIDRPEFAEYIWGNPAIVEFGVFYPPEGDVIEISVARRGNELVRYEIYSIIGLKIRSGELPADNIIALTELNNGIYILAVYAGNRRYTTRILVGK